MFKNIQILTPLTLSHDIYRHSRPNTAAYGTVIDNIVHIPCKVHSLQIPPPCLLFPFLANSFPCKYCSLRIPLLDFLDNSIPCKFTWMRIVEPFLECSFPCSFHPLSLQIQFLANSVPLNSSTFMVRLNKN